MTRPREHDHALPLRVVLKEPEKEIILVALLHAHQLLVDGIHSWTLRRDHHLDGILHEFARELQDFRRERRREEHGLTLDGQLGDEAPDVGQEPHVQHPVGLVQNEVLDLVKIDDALRHQVDETPRRGDHHVRPAPDVLHLAELVHAAEHAGVTRLRVLRILHMVLAGLRRQLARGTQHERTRVARLVALRLLRKRLDDRQQERRRLAGARLRAADEITSFEKRRDRLLLYRRGHRVPGIRYRAAHLLRKTREHILLNRLFHHFPPC